MERTGFTKLFWDLATWGYDLLYPLAKILFTPFGELGGMDLSYTNPFSGDTVNLTYIQNVFDGIIDIIPGIAELSILGVVTWLFTSGIIILIISRVIQLFLGE